jgi:hypothetical protein
MRRFFFVVHQRDHLDIGVAADHLQQEMGADPITTIGGVG